MFFSLVLQYAITKLCFHILKKVAILVQKSILNCSLWKKKVLSGIKYCPNYFMKQVHQNLSDC